MPLGDHMLSRTYYFSIIFVADAKCIEQVVNTNIQTYSGFLAHKSVCPEPQVCYSKIIKDACELFECDATNLIVLAFNKV